MSESSSARRLELRMQVGRLFTPATPINEKQLFAGRSAQVKRIVDTISQRGQHAILFGERGVGKTSLANVLPGLLEGIESTVVARRASVASSDGFSDLWRRIFSQLPSARQIETMGLRPETTTEVRSLAERLPDPITPDDVRIVLDEVGGQCVLILIVDEFDRLASADDARLFADTIKTLADYAVPATIILVGVADSVDDLIAGHESVLRNLVQIPMPRMPRDELEAIVSNRLPQLGMTITPAALDAITLLSRGLPHYTHLVGQHAAWAAIEQGRSRIDEAHIRAAVRTAIDNAQQTIQSAWHQATVSPQKGNLFGEVLLACALATTDDFGFFAAADVREPIRTVTGRNYDIPSFARHLRAFASDAKGRILQEKGDRYQRRFRFANPLMQPYVILRGIAEERISLQQVRQATPAFPE